MALGQTNISISGVKTALSSGVNNLVGLCTSALVNKWSKYKPVRGTWPASSNSKYGLDIPLWNNSAGTWSTGGWNYLQPNTEYRLGDFRGYENSRALTTPPAYCTSSEQDENPVLSPAQPPGGVSSGTATGHFNNSASSIRIILSDLGLSGYYFGLLVITPSGGKWIKTLGSTVNSVSEATGQSIAYSAALNDPTSPASTYQNLPYGVGNFTAYYVISNTNYTSWTQNPSGTIYRLPSETVNGVAFTSSYTFNVQDWVYIPDASQFWTPTQAGSGQYKSSKIYCSDGADPFTITKPAWITTAVYDTSNSGQVSNSSLWGNGMWVRMWPTTANNGYAKEGFVEIGGTNTTEYPITVTHQAAPAEVLPTAGNPSVMTVSGVSGNVTGGLNFTFTPFYVPNNDPTFNVQYLVSVTHNGVETQYYSSGSGGGSATVISCTQNTQKSVANLYYGSATWVDGDDINIYLYYETAPGIS